MGKVVTLGEMLVRYSTKTGVKLKDCDSLSVHYGGSEVNVAVSLASYGHSVAAASKVPDNPLGRGARQHLLTYGVADTQLLFGGDRIGTYLVETGAGLRSASVTYDRAHSSFAEMSEMEWSFDELFGEADIFHVSGITPAVAPAWRKLTVALVKQAKKRGMAVSFDSNYRAKLWSQSEAAETIRKILPYVDYCSMGELDARHLLGIPQYEGQGDLHARLSYYYEEMARLYPNIVLFYATVRKVLSASDNQLTGTLWSDGTLYCSRTYDISYIVDRIGGGDAFAAGVLHGLLTGADYQETIDFATAASCLKHTILGDALTVSEKEVRNFMAASDGRIVR